MPNQSLKEKLNQKFTQLKPKKKPAKQQKAPPQENKTTENKNEKSKNKFKMPKLGSIFKKKMPKQELPTVNKALPKSLKVVDKYSLYEPFSQVFIVQDPKTGEYRIFLMSCSLTNFERGIYNRILEILLAEIESPKEEIKDPRKFFAQEAKKIVDKYRISLGWLPDVSWYKIIYHAERDLVGFGKIDSLMRDPNIEDISCDGVNRPVYIWHRTFESIETNVQFESDEVLDNMVG